MSLHATYQYQANASLHRLTLQHAAHDSIYLSNQAKQKRFKAPIANTSALFLAVIQRLSIYTDTLVQMAAKNKCKTTGFVLDEQAKNTPAVPTFQAVCTCCEPIGERRFKELTNL